MAHTAGGPGPSEGGKRSWEEAPPLLLWDTVPNHDEKDNGLHLLTTDSFTNT